MSPWPPQMRTMTERLDLEGLKQCGGTTIPVEEAGQVLGIGRAAAYPAFKNGQMPHLLLGRKILCPVPSLLRMLGEER